MNWSDDINQTLKYQRNILSVLLIGLLITNLILLFSLFSTYQNKKFQPFVLDISDRGKINIIKSRDSNDFLLNDNVDKYFIFQFIKSIEINHFSSEEERKLFISSLSSSNVYTQVMRNSINSYNDIEINSWVKMKENEYLVRFTLFGKTIKKSKIAIIGYEYEDRDLNDKILTINPLGFLIKYYKVENDQ